MTSDLSGTVVNLLKCGECGGEIERLNQYSLRCIECKKKINFIDLDINIEINQLSNHQKKQIKFFSNEKITSNNIYNLEPWQEEYMRRLTDTIDIYYGMNVVDIGSGSGYMAVELAKKGCNVVATDLSKRSVDRINRVAEKLNLASNLLAINSLAEKLPLKDKSIDLIINNAVLEHIEDERLAISEMNRIASAHSKIFLTVPIKYRYLNPLFLILNWVHDKKIGHLRRYDEKNIYMKFSNYGFTIIKNYYTGHTMKIIKILINKIFKNTFSYKEIEINDRKKEDIKVFSSNIISILKKNENTVL